MYQNQIFYKKSIKNNASITGSCSAYLPSTTRMLGKSVINPCETGKDWLCYLLTDI